MFWEIADDIKRYFKMTFMPSIRNLFSSIRSLAGLLLVMLILQTLLSVICITGIENISSQQAILKDFQVSVAEPENETEKPSKGSGSQETTETEKVEGEVVSVSDNFKTAVSSTSIFIGALVIWGICALTVYKKITFASADRDKYIWGMLITHGAKKKKIKAMLRCELYLPLLAATAAAYPLSIFICNKAVRDYGYSYSHSFIKLLAVLLISYVCIRLVVEYQCFLIRSMSCNDMLREEDAPKSVCFPKKNSRLVKGFTPARYGSSAFLRMRKYYISLALVAAIPAIIWACFYVSRMGEDSYLSSNINEFRITVSSGVSEEDLKKISEDKFGGMQGIESVNASAIYKSSKIYTHMLADGSRFSTTVDSPFYTTTYADNTITLTRNDRAFKQLTGFNIPSIDQGTAVVIMPKDSPKYTFSKGDKLFLAISKSDGSTRAVTDGVATLREELNSEYEYLELRIASVQLLDSASLSKSGFLNINDSYIVLCNDDYEKVTSLDPDSFSSYVKEEDISAENTLDSNASFDLSVPLAKVTSLPTAGDCVRIKGSFTLEFDLTGLPAYEGDLPNVYDGQKFTCDFEYAYINSASVSGDTLTLNLTPYSIIVLESGVGIQPTVVLATGTPRLASSPDSYFANTYENVTIHGGTVSVEGELTVHTSSVVSGAETGTHSIFAERTLTSTDGLLKLEELYADNSFDIACGDSTTLSSMGMDIPAVSDKEAVIILPNAPTNHFIFSVGDKILIATTKEDVTKYDPDSLSAKGNYDTLVNHLAENAYDYTQLYVTEVIYSDDVDAPCVIVSSKSFVRIINKYRPYVSFDIYLSSDVGSEDYVTIKNAINEWATKIPTSPSVRSTGEYLQHLLRKNANYSTVIMIISTLIPLIIPFIWYYPLASLFDRRRTEITVLNAIGKKKRTVRACYFFEGALVCAVAFASVFLLTFPAMFVFKTVCILAELPLEFEYSYLSLPILLTAAAISAVCAAISFAACYSTTFRKKVKKPRRKYGNS